MLCLCWLEVFAANGNVFSTQKIVLWVMETVFLNESVMFIEHIGKCLCDSQMFKNILLLIFLCLEYPIGIYLLSPHFRMKVRGYCRYPRLSVCPSVRLSVCPSVRPSVTHSCDLNSSYIFEGRLLILL